MSAPALRWLARRRGLWLFEESAGSVHFDGHCSAGATMAMQKTIVLVFAIGIAAATLPVISQSAAQNGSVPIFIPNNNTNNNHNRMRHQGGEHYDNVVGNYTRRCTSLDGQFKRLWPHVGDSAGLREGAALHDQGVTHCDAGARLQGIDELSEAIRKIGGIPRVEL
jgi:hypothetical protein